jgi:hypothetical protein
VTVLTASIIVYQRNFGLPLWSICWYKNKGGDDVNGMILLFIIKEGGAQIVGEVQFYKLIIILNLLKWYK